MRKYSRIKYVMISDVPRNRYKRKTGGQLQQHCSSRITSSNKFIDRSIVHSVATNDQNIILHQTMRQMSTQLIKHFWNTPRLGVQKKHEKINQSEKRPRNNCILPIYKSHKIHMCQFSSFFLYRTINVVFQVSL